jgi:hypothetical protein
MLKKLLTSNRGFGLIQTVASLIIVTIAVVGLFITSFYARYKANENYHYRSALLAAAEKIDWVKYKNLGNQQAVITDFPQFYQRTTVVLDDYDGRNLLGQVKYPPTVRLNNPDLAVSPYAVYDTVVIKVTWTEPGDFFIPARTKKVELREDYFRRYDQ